MKENYIQIHFRLEDKNLVEKTIRKGKRKNDAKIDYKCCLIKEKIFIAEVPSGYLNKLRDVFAIGYFTTVWKSKNQPDDIRQKVEILNHPVYGEGVILSSYRKGVDIPLLSGDIEPSGAYRFEFDGTIHDAFRQFGYNLKGKIAEEKDKNLLIVLTEKSERTAEKYGYSMENFY